MTKKTIDLISDFIADYDIKDISHISRFGNTTIIYTKDECCHSMHTLSALNNLLPKNRFLRIHPMHIVSLQYITGFYKKWIVVGGFYLPTTPVHIARFKKELLNQINQQYIFFSAKNIAMHLS